MGTASASHLALESLLLQHKEDVKKRNFSNNIYTITVTGFMFFAPFAFGWAALKHIAEDQEKTVIFTPKGCQTLSITALSSDVENLNDGFCAVSQVKLHSKSWNQYTIAINNQKISFDKNLVRSWSVIVKRNLNG